MNRFPRRSAFHTALLLCLLFVRCGEKRARISEKTVKLISNRSVLRASFKSEVARELESLDFVFTELDSGGFGMMPAESLRAARAVTIKRHAGDDAVGNLLRSKKPLTLEDEIEIELMLDSDSAEESDEESE